MAVIDDVMAEFRKYSPIELADEHRTLKETPTEHRVVKDIDRMAAIKLLMWTPVAVAVSMEWACECCAASNQPCLRMTIKGLLDYAVRDKDVVFLREYAWNCLCCIRRKVKCVIKKRIVNEVYPAGIDCTLTRYGPSHPAMAVPKRGLAPLGEEATRDHGEHAVAILGYDELTVKQYVDDLRKEIREEEISRIITAKDLQALDSRGSIEAFVSNRIGVVQTLFDEYTSMTAAMRPLLDSAKYKHQRRRTAAAICRDFSERLFESVCKTLAICPDAELREVDDKGDRIVSYRMNRKHTASFLRRVSVMLADEQLSSDEEEMDVDDDGDRNGVADNS